MTVILTAQARFQLAEIEIYTRHQFGSEQAERYIAALLDRCAWLADRPEIASLRPELGTDVRSYAQASHRIYFRMQDDDILVIAVLHHAQDIARLE
ncbi:MAG: type II toxin-antitoxin system RelE/ParE family toxin [Pacificimonas sp.]|jgi:toxin ParE1/3/4|nr:type II toxin-antitoxin system RelE/ParE family toxin [Pacificimonas sp.]